jgi:hypothetical protein|eukprot:scaffold472_cov215-Alexandrium_tamarense.AAC.3
MTLLAMKDNQVSSYRMTTAVTFLHLHPTFQAADNRQWTRYVLAAADLDNGGDFIDILPTTTQKRESGVEN